MIQQVLQDFGLSENEIKVYLALLPMKKGCSSTIGTRAGLSRNTVRNVVRCLVKRGLAHEVTEGNTNFYTAEPPERLLHILEEQKTKISKKQSALNQFMGLLQAMQNPTLNCPSVKYYEGRKGIIEIYEDILETGEDHYCWTNLEKKKEIFGSDLDKHIKKRVSKKIKIYGIKEKTEESVKNSKIQNLYRELRLTENLPIKNGEIIIYGNKVAVITFNTNKPIGFIFQSKEIVMVFKGVFQGFWNILTPTKEN